MRLPGGEKPVIQTKHAHRNNIARELVPARHKCSKKRRLRSSRAQNRLAQTSSIILTLLMFTSCVSIHEDKSNTEEKIAVNIRLGTEYLQQGRIETALNYFQKALSENPDSYTTHLMLAEVYKRLGEFSQAEIYFQKAIDKVPSHSSEYGVVHNNYGVYLCIQGLNDQAETHFLNAAQHKLYSTPSAAYENAALCVAKQNKHQAEVYFRKALALNAQQQRSLLEMAKLQFAQQNYLETRHYIQQFHAIAEATTESMKISLALEQHLGKPTTNAPQKPLENR